MESSEYILPGCSTAESLSWTYSYRYQIKYETSQDVGALQCNADKRNSGPKNVGTSEGAEEKDSSSTQTGSEYDGAAVDW